VHPCCFQDILVSQKKILGGYDEGCELPVKYNGKECMFPGKLHLYSYTQKIEILVHGVSVMFERDEEREWRAIVDPSELEKSKSIDGDLLQAIANAINSILN
jgi:hypothetical protein